MSPQDPDALRAAFLDVLSSIAPEAASTPLDPQRSLRDQLDIDSVDLLNLMLGLHRRLGVDIPESDYAHLLDLDSAVRYLGAKLRRGTAAAGAAPASP
jgi:acyl carrier protein